MNVDRVTWIVRLAGLVVLILGLVAFFYSNEISLWIAKFEFEFLGLYDFEWVPVLVVILMALGIRLLAFGFRAGRRFVIAGAVSLAFFIVALAAPLLLESNALYQGQEIGWLMLLVVFPVTITSMVLASVPLGDGRSKKTEPAQPAAGPKTAC
jgi:hypothetical protein